MSGRISRAEFEAALSELQYANMMTLDRIVYRTNVPVYGDGSGARTEALLNRMERKLQQRDKQILDLTAQFVTGFNSMEKFFQSLGHGPYNGYRPSLSREVLGDNAIEIITEVWKERFPLAEPPFVY